MQSLKTEQETDVNLKRKQMVAEAARESIACGDPEFHSDTKLKKIVKGLGNNYSDAELLDILKESADRLGHSPAQKEVFWIYRNFIKQRFQKWPYALKRAGLGKSAGRDGVTLEQMQKEREEFETIMEQIRREATRLGRPPHMAEMNDVVPKLAQRFTNWAEVLEAAGVNRFWERNEAVQKIPDLEPEYRKQLVELKRQAVRLGRPPMKSEVDPGLRNSLRSRCGTWRNVLYQIDLAPVQKISPFSNSKLKDCGKPGKERKHKEDLRDCLYQMINLDFKTRKELAVLRTTAARLKRTPMKNEIPAGTYGYLLHKCGSWQNALYQVGLEPLNKRQIAEIVQQKRS